MKPMNETRNWTFAEVLTSFGLTEDDLEPTDGTYEATEDDLAASVVNALDCCGLTREQLIEQARTGQFSTIRARLAWVAVGDLL